MAKERDLKHEYELQKKYTKFYGLKLNSNTDPDIIEHLSSLDGSFQGYIKRLIREDIARNSSNSNTAGSF